MKRRLATIVGARPQFVKAAALSRAIAATNEFEELLIHTGQHFDAAMSALFFDELAIPPPRHNLGIHGGGHGNMTGCMLIALEAVFEQERPDAVVVFGDTNSTLAAALAAAKCGIPVMHVEAGLRSFNRQMPEEINRVAIDHMSTGLFCPTAAAVANLAREGITSGVHLVGDVMYDATRHARDSAMTRSRILDRLSLRPGTYAVATLHRPSNTDDPVRRAAILDYLQRASGELPVVFPVHPRTRAAIAGDRALPPRIRCIDPIGYFDMHRLLADASAVFTDSGGLQKEAYFHRVPCVTLRDETEWVETIACGWNRLWSVADYQPRREITDYGGGAASIEIVRLIAQMLDA